MSRIRVVAARLYAAFIHAQLFVMSCRSKLTKFPAAHSHDVAAQSRSCRWRSLPIWFAMSNKVPKQHSHHH